VLSELALKKMRPRVKELVVVPFDQSLVDDKIAFDALTPASQPASQRGCTQPRPWPGTYSRHPPLASITAEKRPWRW